MTPEPQPQVGNSGGQDQVYDLLLTLYFDIASRYYGMIGLPFHTEKERLDWYNRYQLARMRPR